MKMAILLIIAFFANATYAFSVQSKVAVVTWTSTKDLLKYRGAFDNVRTYASLNGYDRLVNTSQYDFRSDPVDYCHGILDCHSRTPYWFKPYIIRDICIHNSYDWILYIDSDVVLNRFDVTVASFVERAPHADVFASFMGQRVNAGVLLLRGGSACVEFVNTWVHENGFYSDDNGSFNHALILHSNLDDYRGECREAVKGIDWGTLKGSLSVKASPLYQAYDKVDQCINKYYDVDQMIEYSAGAIGDAACATGCQDLFVGGPSRNGPDRNDNPNNKVMLLCQYSTAEKPALQSEDKRLMKLRGRSAQVAEGCESALCNSRSFAVHSKTLFKCKTAIEIPQCIARMCSIGEHGRLLTSREPAPRVPNITEDNIISTSGGFHNRKLLAKITSLDAEKQYCQRQDELSASSESLINIPTMSSSEVNAFMDGDWRKYMRSCFYQELPLYYWNSGKGGWTYSNFGDAVNVDIAKFMLGKSDISLTSLGKERRNRGAGDIVDKHDHKLLMVGSVLLNANIGDTIWGTGLHYNKNTSLYRLPYGPSVDIRALRGPLSFAVLGGLPMVTNGKIPIPPPSFSFGDPAMLVPLIWPEYQAIRAQTKLNQSAPACVVPHYFDLYGVKLSPNTQRLAKLLPNRDTFDLSSSTSTLRVVSPGLTPKNMAKELVQCSFVMSLSLHGVIFAESFGIPARWVFNPSLYLSSLTETSLKYHDYFLSTGRPCSQHAISVQDGLKKGGLTPLPKNQWATMAQKLLKTFPYDAVCRDVAPEYVNFNQNVSSYVVNSQQITIPGHDDSFNPSIVEVPGTTTATLTLLSFRSRYRQGASSMRTPINANTMGLAFVGAKYELLPNKIAFHTSDSALPSLTVSGVIEFKNPFSIRPSLAQDPRLIVISDRLLLAVYSNTYTMDIKTPSGKIKYKETRRLFISTIVLDLPSLTLDPAPYVVVSYDGSTVIWNEQKNWTPFSYEGKLYFCKDIIPHNVVTLAQYKYDIKSFRGVKYSPDQRLLSAPLVARTSSDSPLISGWVKKWGFPRGSTQAVYLKSVDSYLTVFHSSVLMKSQHSKGMSSLHYFNGAYLFQHKPPFAITAFLENPIIAPGMYDSKNYKTHKPIQCAFASGLIANDTTVSITFGKQDYEAWVMSLDIKKFLDSFTQIPVDVAVRDAFINPSLDESQSDEMLFSV